MLSGGPAKQDAEGAELHVVFPKYSSSSPRVALNPPLSPPWNTAAQGLLSFKFGSVRLGQLSFNQKGEEKKLMSKENG